MRKARRFYVVVVTGGVSGIDVAVVSVPVVAFGFGPSLPLLGCGAALPMPCAAGVAVSDCAGLVTSGGAFW
jgi:hypothetical protein